MCGGAIGNLGNSIGGAVSNVVKPIEQVGSSIVKPVVQVSDQLNAPVRQALSPALEPVMNMMPRMSNQMRSSLPVNNIPQMGIEQAMAMMPPAVQQMLMSQGSSRQGYGQSSGMLSMFGGMGSRFNPYQQSRQELQYQSPMMSFGRFGGGGGYGSPFGRFGGGRGMFGGMF